ncbi:flagellar motor switch protein FliG [Bosea sp. 2KB_26]|uniref:flagellar motor switch protein FliG n=1 Tax=Bosea sp. 2KB_26 TaxID=3237475 RepID=UPI003F91CD3C
MSLAVTTPAPNHRVLSGQQRVAALLLTMGQGAAKKVLQYFDPEEVKAVTKAAASLGQITTMQIEDLVEEFADGLAHGTDLVGNSSEIQKLLTGILPDEQVTDLMEELRGNANRSIWERISSVSETAIATYLVKEHPQTAALILSKVKPTCAAKVISQLPADVRSSVTRRMLTLKPIIEETMKNIEAALQENFVTSFSKDAGSDTHAKMATIINKMERGHMEDVLADLASVRPRSAEILKGMLFTFDDVIKLSPKDRTTLFDQIQPDRVSVALKGAPDELRQVILGSLASRVRRMVEHDITTQDAVSARDVTDARRVITDLALEMANRGEIVVQSESDLEVSRY